MKRLHIIVGSVSFVIFLSTGVYMKFNFPGLYDGNEAVRFMYRASHIYLLLASLINVALGIYISKASGYRKAQLQKTGSVLVVLGTLILTGAFFYEPSLHNPNRMATLTGIICLLTGVMCHTPNSVAKHGHQKGQD